MNAIFKIGLISLLFSFSPAHADDSVSVCNGRFDKDSLKHGIWICRKNNYISLKEKYKHGKLIYYVKFNEKGDIVETRNKKGKVIKNNPCGC